MPVSHQIWYWSIDRANNLETPPKTATFTVSAAVDTTPPTTTNSAPPYVVNSVNYYSSVSTITLTATDNAGGWGVARTYYKLDSGPAFSVTGGTQYTSGPNTVIVFTSSGSLVCSGTLPGASVLAVGGGGGGGNGGGGAGGVINGTIDLSGTMPVTVGSGGTAGTASYAGPYTPLAGNGGNSSIGSLSAIGGGGGGGYEGTGASGGSGGGGGYAPPNYGAPAGGSGTSGRATRAATATPPSITGTVVEAAALAVQGRMRLLMAARPA